MNDLNVYIIIVDLARVFSRFPFPSCDISVSTLIVTVLSLPLCMSACTCLDYMLHTSVGEVAA